MSYHFKVKNLLMDEWSSKIEVEQIDKLSGFYRLLKHWWVSLNSFYLSIDVGLVSTGFSNIGECHSTDSTGLVPDFIGTKISLCRSQLLVNLGSNKIWYRYKSGVFISVPGIWDLGAKYYPTIQLNQFL